MNSVLHMVSLSLSLSLFLSLSLWFQSLLLLVITCDYCVINITVPHTSWYRPLYSGYLPSTSRPLLLWHHGNELRQPSIDGLVTVQISMVVLRNVTTQSSAQVTQFIQHSVWNTCLQLWIPLYYGKSTLTWIVYSLCKIYSSTN